MGASDFYTFRATTEELEAVFNAACEDSRYQNGHGGYTGTIAEKTEVTLRNPEPFATYQEAEDWAAADLRKNDHDKWGPAWAVKVAEPKGYLFYGYASS